MPLTRMLDQSQLSYICAVIYIANCTPTLMAVASRLIDSYLVLVGEVRYVIGVENVQ